MLRKRILFANHAQYEGRNTNLGDWAIFEQMIEKLFPEITSGEIEIVVPTSDVKYTASHYPVKAFKRGGIVGIWNTLCWIIKSDVVMIGGGEIVQDRSSLVYIPYQLIRPFIAKLFGKKLFAYAIGVGEKKEISLLGKWQSQIVLNMFDVITVRDKKSYQILKEYLKVKKPKIYLTADPALNLSARTVEQENGKNYFVVSVRSVYHRNHNILPFAIRKRLGLVPKEYYIAIEEFKAQIAKIVDTLIESHAFHVKFLNTYIGSQMSASDDVFTSTVIQKISPEHQSYVDVIDTNYTPAQTKFVLSKAEFIITVPLHPLILGASENVPVFSLAYASKNRCFMSQISHPEHIYPIEKISDKIDVNKILSDIENVIQNKQQYVEQLDKTIVSLKKREAQNSNLLLELIRKA